MEFFAEKNCIQENLCVFKKSVQKISDIKERVHRNEAYSAIKRATYIRFF